MPAKFNQHIPPFAMKFHREQEACDFARFLSRPELRHHSDGEWYVWERRA